MTRGPRRRVVVTAGPTREYIDPVRYLSNESSGRMGFAIAAAAAERGDDVILIAGPVHQETPKGVRRVDVISARDMQAAVRAAFLGAEGRSKEHFGVKGADVLFMAAAVGDWRPKRRRAGKWRGKDQGDDAASLELVKNPDIVATVARRKAGRLVVCFALETGDGLRRARRKLIQKRADFVVLNDASALGADLTDVQILGPEGLVAVLRRRPKSEVAKRLVELGLAR